MQKTTNKAPWVKCTYRDKLEYVLVQILWVGGAATFFAALLIGMMERGGS